MKKNQKKHSGLEASLIAIVPINAAQGNLFQLKDNMIVKICADANLLMIMTNSFHGQAGVNTLDTEYQNPAMFAIMYEKAQLPDVMFTTPRATPVIKPRKIMERMMLIWLEVLFPIIIIIIRSLGLYH